MLAAPGRLTADPLARALADGWGITATSIQYRAVGFGSHHWELLDTDAARWFVTADDLSSDQAKGERLHAALDTAIDLRDAGAEFVIAPIRTHEGEPFVSTP